MNKPQPKLAEQARAPHDHRLCVEQALEDAETVCDASGARLTQLRRKVLELVWSGHKPISAYDILDMLSKNRKKAAPPTVYRALDFLLAEGLVHRIESLNAYIGCPHPSAHHNGQFLICQNCRTVTEIDDSGIKDSMATAAQRKGFTIASGMIEIMGLCPKCQKLESVSPESKPISGGSGR